jgi:hypothetical protein
LGDSFCPLSSFAPIPATDKMIKEKKDPYVETALASFGKAPLNQPNK